MCKRKNWNLTIYFLKKVPDDNEYFVNFLVLWVEGPVALWHHSMSTVTFHISETTEEILLVLWTEITFHCNSTYLTNLDIVAAFRYARWDEDWSNGIVCNCMWKILKQQWGNFTVRTMIIAHNISQYIVLKQNATTSSIISFKGISLMMKRFLNQKATCGSFIKI